MTGLMFHQIHMIESKSWDVTWFAACFGAFAMMSVVTGIISGPLIDRYSARRLITWYLMPMGFGIAALVVSAHPLVVLAWFVLSGVTSGLHRSVASAFWAEAYGRSAPRRNPQPCFGNIGFWHGSVACPIWENDRCRDINRNNRSGLCHLDGCGDPGDLAWPKVPAQRLAVDQGLPFLLTKDWNA